MATRERHEKLSAAQANRIRHHLNDVLQSPAYIGSKRSCALLQALVDDALAGRFDELHERSIGVRMYGRTPDYDTANDAIVRVNATEVRKRLAQYYRELDAEPLLRIELPSGTYVPRFVFQEPCKADSVAPAPTPAVETTVLPGFEDFASLPAQLGVPSAVPQRKWIAALAVVLLLVVGAASLLWLGLRPSHPASAAREPAPPSILVLPMQNLSGDSSQEFFADGITDELIADLGQVSGLRTISRTSAMSFKKTPKTLPEIAHELQVQWVVEGSVQRDGKHVRVTAQLIDAATDHPVWSTSFTRDISDTLKLQGELALAIAEKIQVQVTPKTRERFDQARSVNEEVQQTYLQGMVLLQSSTASINSEQAQNIQAAIQLFQRSVQLDPSFAQPHAALAESYSRLVECGAMSYAKAYPLQKAEALRAIELNPLLAEGHAELASATIDLDYGWATAQTEFRKALDLNPGSVPIRLRYALYLIKTGNPVDAVAEVELCRKLDPLSARLVLEAEYIYFFSRKYDEAVALDRDGLAKNIVTDQNNHLFGQIYLVRGDNAKAIAELKPSVFPTGIGRLGVAYARSGQTAAANAELRILKASVDKHGVGAYETALIYTAMGDKDNAFKWLERGFAIHDKGVTYLRIDPFLDPLRSDPRFAELLKRAGFSS
jgi:TolB-like protein/Tfp pilus assembly protein PilF